MQTQQLESESEHSMTIKDRLSKLEDELDQLLKLQESIKPQPQKNGSISTGTPITGSSHPWHGGCSCALSQPAAVPLCQQEPSAAKPLTDITKFLQHINLNLTRGTQAITKIAHTSVQKRPDVTTDHIFMDMKELCEEKDKRLRAENQVKLLKEDLKKVRADSQLKTDTNVIILQRELKETKENLDTTKLQLDQIRQECKAAEYLWPLKYDTLQNDLREERAKQRESNKKIIHLQKMLQRHYFDTEEHLELQKSVRWLEEQNSNLSYLIKRLESDSQTRLEEISSKNKIIGEHLTRIKQLAILCERLRDVVQTLREKCTSMEIKLNQSLQHCQRLSDRLLNSQIKIDQFTKLLAQNEQELSQKTELLNNKASYNEVLQSRINQMSDLMEEQTKLIAKQSETISSKDVQLCVAYDNIKLQKSRLEEIENKSISAPDDFKIKQMINSDFRHIMIQLEDEKEKLAIKDKIIESNLQTIGQMKITLSERDGVVHGLKINISEKEKKLAVEQTKNEQLISKIKILHSQKDDLKNRIAELEEEIDTMTASDHAKLEHLEEQIREKHKKWEEQKKMLESEKGVALQARKSIFEQLTYKEVECEQQVETHRQIVQDLKDQVTREREQVNKLTCELQKANEQSANLKKNFDDKLHAVYNTWQKAMEGLRFLDNMPDGF